MNTRSLTEQLADWLLAEQVRGMPASALAWAEYYLLDWLGSALAGRVTEPGKALIGYAQAQPAGACSLIGGSGSASAETAALVNGGLSHIVEMDDLDRTSVTHPGTVIIPAALAIAQREGRGGRDLLHAIVAGYEVGIRIGEAVGRKHYFHFHNTATCGIFGSTAAAGWLLGLSREQLVWALGNAGTMAAGLWEFNTDGDMSKHLHAGMAAANGIRAADLAALNFTGARHILEGQRGFFAGMAADATPDMVVAGLGEGYKIGSVSIKPHASCRHTHPAIDAALMVRPQINGRPITRVEIDSYQAALDLCDNPDPQRPYAAKFSLHYCVASALLNGSAGLVDFSPDAIQKPNIRALLQQTQVQVAPDLEQRYPVQWPAHVRVTLADGAVYEAEVLDPKGDPENALNDAEMESKFRQLAEYGGADPNKWLAWLDRLHSADIVALPK